MLTTERAESIVVLGLKTHVRRVDTPAMRTAVVDCTGRNAYFERQAELVVDSRPPRFKFSDKSGTIERIGLNLGKGDAADFHLEASAESPEAVYEWTVDLELLVGGEPKSVTVSDGGRPFRVVGALPSQAAQVDLSTRLQDYELYCLEHPRDAVC